ETNEIKPKRSVKSATWRNIMESGKDSTMVGWSAGCGESYLSSAGSAGRKPTVERQQGADLRLHRINTKLRCAPAPPSGKPGRPPVHGEVLHPGHAHPEVVPDVERTLLGEAGAIRLRRWSTLHYEEFPETILDVVRIDDPAYDVPLIVGSTARDLRLEEFWS